MNEFEVLVPLAGVVLGSLIVLIPITGLTARFALKPVLEALGRYREGQGAADAVQLIERRQALLEEQVHSIERAVRDLMDEAEFRRQLESGAPPAAQPRLAATPMPRQVEDV